jgi:hypothetical protein
MAQALLHDRRCPITPKIRAGRLGTIVALHRPACRLHSRRISA